MMRIFALLSLITIALNAQNTALNNGYIVGTHLGMTYDVLYDSKDIDQHSPDMKSKDNFGYVSQYSLEYRCNAKMSYGLKLNFGTIKGENDVEYYQTSFKELSGMVRYTYPLVPETIHVYTSASLGFVAFNATRHLMLDDGAIPQNTIKDSSFKWDCAFGLEVPLRENIFCYLEACLNEVRHDGFDGWDYETNVDKYNFYALGFKFLLNKN